ncbi:MAG TPA: flagellar hook capping FlgD N-terminal domain-containing protein [Deltaproteobacteria bacterium]|nr:flagellar hook capping FlgD N-terminal domain-containing protein [Deltaproteobacteria bacterium]HOM29554.1 flagellar hook capping FlgD N-terminal domain-containing protein [Deltaproteobacteria bacterium]HPP81783.1 flagellar hook capping FlgD N-terminal domain-containing protein [Deltaproteobacteria bacterium]
MAVGLDNILAVQSAADNASAGTSITKVDEQKNMFLKLLVKQLQYQDPLNPLENTEFATQLAQFSMLESMNTMSENITLMTQFQNSMNSMEAASFIGKTVNASGNVISFTGAETAVDFALADNASEVRLTIYNESGTPVRTMTMNDVAKGDVSWRWDGRNDRGETVSPGRYYFTVGATGYDGSAVNTSTYANGVVTGVRFDNGTIYLQVGDKEVRLADITRISG